MYIPTSFFSSQGSCVTVSTSTITGSGTVTSGSFISGGYFWDYWQFNNTLDPITSSSVNLSFQASFNILSGSTGQAKLFLVGGGGAGGYGECVVTTPPQCEATSGAGGGGGGIVYYDKFPLASGSYTISVGAGGGNPLNAGVRGRTGGNTTFTFSYPYSPFTSSVLTAYGGGAGGYIITDGVGGNTCTIQQGISGGSAGGAVCCSNQDGANNVIQAGYDGLGGLNGANQGNDALGCQAGSSAVRASGGGGAGTAGALATGQTSVGGDGALYNLTGTPLYYAAGGGGAFGQGFLSVRGQSANGLGTAGIGNGGQGQTLSYPQGTTATNGTVIIVIPRCLSAFSCKNFAITGSNTTLSYLNCGFPFVTSSKLSSNQDQFTACLLTYSGSNTPVLLTGTTTSSVISDCSAQLTSSAGCNCTYIRAVPNSGTQTINLFPCNGSGSVTQSVPPAGKFFCIENYSVYSFPSGAVTEYGSCITGSCQGIQYTASVVTCSSMIATAGASGGTLTYVPCGSGSAVQITLSGSESRSICAAYTSSFLSLTGIGSTFSNYSSCSYTPPPPPPPIRPAVSASLKSYIDIAFTSSYSGTGAILTDVTNNGISASLDNTSAWVYDTSSLATPVLKLIQTGSASKVTYQSIPVSGSYSLMISLYNKNVLGFSPQNHAPLFQTNPSTVGPSTWNGLVWQSEYVNACIGQINSDVQLQFVTSSAWRLYQVSFDGITNTVNFAINGLTGSYTASDFGYNTSFQFNVFGQPYDAGSGTGGYGSGSAIQVLGIYTGSLSTSQLLQNWNALSGRYI